MTKLDEIQSLVFEFKNNPTLNESPTHIKIGAAQMFLIEEEITRLKLSLTKCAKSAKKTICGLEIVESDNLDELTVY